MALIELARNVLGLASTHSEEVDPATPHPTLVPLSRVLGPQHYYYQTMPAQLCLGTCALNQVGDTIFQRIYPDAAISEHFRHRYTFNVQYHPELRSTVFEVNPVLRHLVNHAGGQVQARGLSALSPLSGGSICIF